MQRGPLAARSSRSKAKLASSEASIAIQVHEARLGATLVPMEEVPRSPYEGGETEWRTVRLFLRASA